MKESLARLIVAGVLSLTLPTSLGCARPSANVPAADLIEDTTLGAGDVFEVSVFGEEEFSGKFQVGSDGTILYPFLGALAVAGKEVGEVARTIADGLERGEYLQEPQVSIFVQASNSKRISVLGAVAKPGMFPVTPGLTVVQAVSNAGGFTALANKDETVVTRRVGGKLERYRVAVSEASRGRAEDFRLRAGDIVFVPERVF